MTTRHRRAITAAAPSADELPVLLVPWNTPAAVTDDGESFYLEQHLPGSVMTSPGQSIPVYDGHTVTGETGPHVADVVQLADTDAGLTGVIKMLPGAERPAYDGLSIEFEPFVTEDSSGIVSRVRSQLTHLAFTPAPAFAAARVLRSTATALPAADAVAAPTAETGERAPTETATETTDPQPTETTDQEETPAMDDETTTETTDDGAAAEETRRRSAAATLSGAGGARTQPRYETFGHFAQARVNGTVTEQERQRFARALATTTTVLNPGTMPEAWVTDIVDLIGISQPFVEAFSSVPLPEKGDDVSYPRVTVRPTVAKQAAENDQVSSTAAVVTKGTAPVETYAGGQGISIQEVKRSDPSYLALAMELYAEEMAVTTDKAAIAAVDAAILPANAIALASTDDTELNDKVVAGIKLCLQARVPNDLAFVLGLDVWELFANAKDTTGRPLYPSANPMNASGRISLTDPESGQVRDLTFTLDPNMAPKDAYLGWKRAYTSALSPVETIDADVVATLGREFAIYRFGAHLVRRPTAIVRYRLP